jgi:hypothetical protein
MSAFTGDWTWLPPECHAAQGLVLSFKVLVKM